MGIPEKIDQIIAARQTKVPKLTQALQRFQEVKTSVDALEDFRKSIPESEGELSNRLNSIVTDGFYQEYDSVKQELERLLKRFSRKHIHMSFVGKAGQGKSLVMQNISGLKGDVIPSSDGSDCTGAKSIITNSDSETVNAEIEFYSQQELLDIVNRYLENIWGEDSDIYRQYSVRTVSDIKSLPIGEFNKALDRREGEASSKFKHLCNYVEHVGDFEAHIGLKITIPAEQIEEYVAQYKNDDKSVKYYKFLGVKGANIKCHFPCSDCGKIVLVDTIGLGATSLGVEEAMRDAISNDSDAIVYMFRPDPLRPRLSSDDYQIIDKISGWVSHDYAKEMLFWVFNRVETEKGKNTTLIPELMKEVQEQKNIPVCKCIDVNCFDRSKVEEKLLLPILEQMSKNLEKIDRLLIDRLQERLSRLHEEYSNISIQLQRLFSKAYVTPDMRRHLENPIHKLYNAWTGNLRTYCLELKKERNKENEFFSYAFNEKLKNVFCIPTLEQIQNHVMQGSKTGPIVFEEMTNYIRLKIINDFFTLDESLRELVRNLKNDIVHIMADDADRCGRMGKVVPYNNEPDKWLEELLNVTKANPQLVKIQKALKSLIEFNLSVRGYLIYIVRNSMDKIDDQISNIPTLEGLDDIDENIKAESIHRWLERYIEDIYKKIRDECQEYLKFPNNALFAASRDFLDRICYAIDDLESSMSMKDEWRYFYEDHMTAIWSDECEKHAAKTEQNANFKQLAEKFRRLSTEEVFTI